MNDDLDNIQTFSMRPPGAIGPFDFLDSRMLDFPTSVCLIDQFGKSDIYYEESGEPGLLFISYPSHLILVFKNERFRDEFFDSFSEADLKCVCDENKVELAVFSSFWWLN